MFPSNPSSSREVIYRPVNGNLGSDSGVEKHNRGSFSFSSRVPEYQPTQHMLAGTHPWAIRLSFVVDMLLFVNTHWQGFRTQLNLSHLPS